MNASINMSHLNVTDNNYVLNFGFQLFGTIYEQILYAITSPEWYNISAWIVLLCLIIVRYLSTPSESESKNANDHMKAVNDSSIEWEASFTWYGEKPFNEKFNKAFFYIFKHMNPKLFNQKFTQVYNMSTLQPEEYIPHVKRLYRVRNIGETDYQYYIRVLRNNLLDKNTYYPLFHIDGQYVAVRVIDKTILACYYTSEFIKQKCISYMWRTIARDDDMSKGDEEQKDDSDEEQKDSEQEDDSDEDNHPADKIKAVIKNKTDMGSEPKITDIY